MNTFSNIHHNMWHINSSYSWTVTLMAKMDPLAFKISSRFDLLYQSFKRNYVMLWLARHVGTWYAFYSRCKLCLVNGRNNLTIKLCASSYETENRHWCIWRKARSRKLVSTEDVRYLCQDTWHIILIISNITIPGALTVNGAFLHQCRVNSIEHIQGEHSFLLIWLFIWNAPYDLNLYHTMLVSSIGNETRNMQYSSGRYAEQTYHLQGGLLCNRNIREGEPFIGYWAIYIL